MILNCPVQLKISSSILSFDDSGSRQSLVLNTIQRSAAGTYQLIIKEPTRTQETTISQEVIVKVACKCYSLEYF